MQQLSFADIQIAQSRKPSRISLKLKVIDELVDWQAVRSLVSVIDKTKQGKGGAPHKDLLSKVKMLFLQHLYNLSDPELEDQVNDRLSFQQFAGIDFDTSVPDFTTIWRFKEKLIAEDIMDDLFDLILSFIEAKGCLLKKGTCIDATIIQSSTKPLSKKRRKELEQNPSSQIDTDAKSTQKGSKKYFGYCLWYWGHIGVDMTSKIIRKRAFTSAKPHDSNVKYELCSGDEQAIFADSAYSKQQDKRIARLLGIHYGVLDKATKKRKLSNRQKKRNKKKSSIRSQVEHPFGFMKSKSNYQQAVAKTKDRNALRFDFNCIIYNLMRSSFLIRKGRVTV